MNKIIKAILVIIFPVLLIGGIPPHPKVYYCNSILTQITIDGNLNDDEWERAEWSDLFVDIRGDSQLKPYLNTKVKMLWDEEFLYIGALIEEPHIWANQTKNESVIYYDNDFEVFIDPDGDTHNYLEFEFNALNVWWDLFLTKPYRSGGMPMNSWTCNEKVVAVKIEGSINDPGGSSDSCWSVEIAIPFSCVGEVIQGRYLKPVIDDVWRINFSRVQWETQVIGDDYVKTNASEDNWVWSPQGKIDMHMPEYWGYLVFRNNESDLVEYIDKDWETKYILMHLYDSERLYHRENGVYNINIDNIISIDKKYLVDVSADIEYNRFLFSIQRSENIWCVDQTGRLWSEKK